jgi:hypothetical protein
MVGWWQDKIRHFPPTHFISGYPGSSLSISFHHYRCFLHINVQRYLSMSKIRFPLISGPPLSEKLLTGWGLLSLGDSLRKWFRWWKPKKTVRGTYKTGRKKTAARITHYRQRSKPACVRNWYFRRTVFRLPVEPLQLRRTPLLRR